MQPEVESNEYSSNN